MRSKINYYILIPKGEWERFSKSLNKAVAAKLKKLQSKRQSGDNGYSGGDWTNSQDKFFARIFQLT